MSFQPQPDTPLSIEGKIYKITEHPTAKGVPYGQEGRRAVVYQLISEDNKKYALKVFKDRFRIPGMVSVAEFLEPYSVLPGLQVCERIVLTASRHRDLLSLYPEMTYAVLMPWVEGPTWQEILLTEDTFSPARSLTLAKRYAEIMVGMEEISLAHCDISGANLIIQAGDQPALVDLEEMYNPDFIKPESLPAGSPGYAHKTAPKGLWNTRSDRFAGAVLLAEMLCWHDHAVQETAWGESFFSPRDMQNENQRLDLLRKSLEKYYGKRILDLFNQAWLSDSLRDCPTFAEWSVALPGEIKIQDQVEISQANEVESHPAEGDVPDLILRAQKAAEGGDKEKALSMYRKAITLAPSELSGEIKERIKALKEGQQQDKQTALKKVEYPTRSCRDCGKKIPAGQEVCPHCEGKPGVHKEKPSKSKEKNLTAILFRLGAGLIFVFGIILVILGQGGKGPFSSLAVSKQEQISTAIGNLTPTETQSPTKTPVPPTPTVAPPMVILDYLENVAITQIDYFESNMGWDLWIGKISNGVLEVIGKDWNGLSKEGRISEGEGIIIDFKYEKNSEFELMFDYGEWWTDAYRRFGIYVWESYPQANLWLGKNGLGFNNLYGNFQPKADTWYTLLMAVDTDGEFLALMWDPTDPTKIFSYHEKAGEKWAGYNWVFKLGANVGTITFDNFMKITFNEIRQ